jgi:hypothetical protein
LGGASIIASPDARFAPETVVRIEEVHRSDEALYGSGMKATIIFELDRALFKEI